MTPTDRPTTFGLTTQEWQPDPIGAYLPAAAVLTILGEQP